MFLFEDSVAEIPGKTPDGSRLVLRLATAIFLAAAIIGSLAIVPSYMTREQAYHAEAIKVGDIVGAALADMVAANTPRHVLEQAGNRFAANSDILGGAICDANDGCPIKFGDEIGDVDGLVAGGSDFDGSGGNRILTVKTLTHDGQDYRIILGLDRAWIDDAMQDYLLGAAALIGGVSMALSLITMVLVGRTVIKPLMQLSTSHTEAIEKRAQNDLTDARTALEGAVAQRTNELETVQKQLTDALDSMDDGFAYFGPDGRLALLNEHYRRSHPGSEEVIKVGATLEDILRYGVTQGWYSGSEKDPEAWVQQRLAVRREASGQPWITLGSNGRHYRIRDYRTKDGGTVTMRVDITEQMRQAKEFAAAKEAAEEASRAKSEFLATMSHEIRTPMNGVMGMANLLMDSNLSPQQRSMVRTILESSNSLLTVINDILDFSKIESGKIKLESSAFRLTDSIDSALELLQGRAREKGIVLGSFVDPEMPELVQGDESRLRQVIINLAGNGVKFTQSGSVTIEARAVGQEDGKSLVRVAVHDTGPGIPETSFNKLFMDFSQLDASRSREHEGTGLGLAISRRLIELMGGEIGVESKVGHGSTFWFELPLTALKGPRYSDADIIPALKILVHAGDAQTDAVLERQLKAWGATPEILGDDHRHDQVIPKKFDAALIDAGYFVNQRKAREFALLQAHGTAVIVLAAGDFTSPDIRPDKVLLKPARQSDLFDAIMQVHRENMGERVEPSANSDRKEDESIRSRTKGVPPSRILVAEDNPVNQQVIRMILTKMGHTIDLAGNGAEAVALARQAPYDLILMDVHMPELDGFAATQEIRQLGGKLETVPVVALTANVEAGVEKQCFESGMTGYITKPIKVESLAEILRNQLPGKTHANRRERIVH